MSDLNVFSYLGNDVRVVDVTGVPHFVVVDVCRILDLTNPSMATKTLDNDDLSSVEVIDTMGRKQFATAVTEAGLYELAFQSRKAEAKQFRRWVTHTVLPELRQTGSFSVAQVPAVGVDVSTIRQLNQAVGFLLKSNEDLTAQVTELTPRADAWDELAAADGDYEVADAAKILARAGIDTGQQRLFTQLAEEVRWIFRGHHGKWTAYQSAVNNGYLAEKPQSHHHPRTGALVMDPPQVRVTVRGLERLRVRLGSLEERPNLRAVSA
jgi:anti-repressor protein